MTDTSALVDGWARAWGGDPAELRTRYADGATAWSLGPDGCVPLDRAAFEQQERRGRLQVPDRTAAPRTIVHAGDLVVVEWLVTGTGAEDLVPMVVPAATWWRLDGDGRIVDEVRALDWSARVILDDEQRRPLPPVEGARRSQGWYRDFVDRLLEVVAFDPALARSSAYAEGVGSTVMTAGPAAGAATAAAGPGFVPGAADVACVGTGGTIAVRIGLDAPAGLVLLTLDGSDRVVSERCYGGGWWPPPA